jgi:hypothetical protein
MKIKIYPLFMAALLSFCSMMFSSMTLADDSPTAQNHPSRPQPPADSSHN